MNSKTTVTVTPVEGWRLQDKRGYMAFDSTPSGRLVPMLDVVRWIMDEKSFPCRVAVEAVCTELEADGAVQWLYMAQPGDYAKPVDSSVDFSLKPIRSFWEGWAGEETRDPSDTGIAGAIKSMRRYWTDVTEPGAGNWIGQDVLNPLCMRMDKAHELWGYGVAAESSVVNAGADGGDEVDALPDFAALVQYRSANKGARWDLGSQLAVLHAEYTERGGTPTAYAALAQELGTTRQNIEKVLSRDRKRPAPATRVFSSQSTGTGG